MLDVGFRDLTSSFNKFRTTVSCEVLDSEIQHLENLSITLQVEIYNF